MKDFQYKPLISVIVPIYNSKKYLYKCLDSLVNQTYKNFEILCIDDYSKDGSADIVERYSNADSRFVLLKNQKNLGPGISRNNGVEKASGEYILFLDSDDWLVDDALEKLVDCLNKYKNPDIVSFLYYDVDGKTGKISLEQKITDSITGTVCNLRSNPLSFVYLGFGTNKLLKKKFLTENNITFCDNPCLEDVNHFFELITHAGQILFLDKPLLYYRHLPTSRSTDSYKYINYHLEHLNTTQKIIADFPYEVKMLCLSKIYRNVLDALFKAFGYFKISYTDLKKILTENILPEALNDEDLLYYHSLYNKIVVQNRSRLYIRTLFIFKTFFTDIFNLYKRLKQILNFKR